MQPPFYSLDQRSLPKSHGEKSTIIFGARRPNFMLQTRKIKWDPVKASPSLSNINMSSRKIYFPQKEITYFVFPCSLIFLIKFKRNSRGSWVAQPVKRPTSAQVMISWFVSSSPTSGSVLTTQSLKPALDSCLPLSAPPPLKLYLSHR